MAGQHFAAVHGNRVRGEARRLAVDDRWGGARVVGCHGIGIFGSLADVTVRVFDVLLKARQSTSGQQQEAH